MLKLDLEEYFNLIKQLEYFIIKLETPYVPRDFPKNYAIGKDIDIIVSGNDFDKIKEITQIFSRNYPNYTIIIYETDLNSFRLRFQEDNKLHYQIDIRTLIEGISEETIIKCFEGRLKNNNYYILPPKLERFFRELEYKKYGNLKPWHKIWLDNN